jgi:large subunit ribosomal protein L6
VGFKGPKGELVRALPGGITLKVQGDKLLVERADDSRENRSKHGLMRAHFANMLKGVTEGWTRELEINGVGYRAEVTGDTLNMALGYSHPVAFKLPKGVTAKVDKNMLLPDKQRDADYLRRLRSADWRTRLIKLADTYDNRLTKQFPHII